MGLLDALFGGEVAYEPVECKIKVDGEEISELYPFLKEVQVELSRAAAGTGQITFDTMRDEQGSWLVQDSELLIPWKKIEIIAQFGSYSETIMTGYILNVRANHPTDMAASQVVVNCQDESVLLDREYTRRAWSTEENPLSDDQIVSQLGSAAGLTVEAQTGLMNTVLYQADTSVHFIQARARANGFEFYVRNGTLYFGPPALEGEPQAAITVYAGRSGSCLSFSLNFDGHRPDSVHVARAVESGTGMDEETVSPDLPLLGTTAADSESMGLSPFTWNLDQPGGTSFDADIALAQARANENSFKISAEGELDGALYKHVLLTHKTVLVDGVGNVNNGLYYVDKVTHVFSQDGYRQKFTLLRNATGETGF